MYLGLTHNSQAEFISESGEPEYLYIASVFFINLLALFAFFYLILWVFSLIYRSRHK